MHRKSVRTVIVALLLAGLTTSASAGSSWKNDAGSGTDAGDTRALATGVSFGTSYVGTFTPADTDWYAASASASGPACVVATAETTTTAFFTLGTESSSGSSAAPMRVTPDARGVAGVAAMTPLTATLRVRDDPSTGYGYGYYGFRLDRVGIPAAGDAGAMGDAGDSIGSATRASSGCIGGRLSPLDFDLRDVYAVEVLAGDAVTYSLASAGDVRLVLVDALGNAIGPTLEPGQIATVPVDSSGTYYMSTSSTSMSDDGYVSGLTLGPEPTSCRPYCLG